MDKLNCAGDGDGDGVVDVNDIVGVITGWGGSDPDFDFSPACGDGVIDVNELNAVILNWGPCP